MAPKLRILSLGAGVQSTTLALMAAHGELEHMPDCAIFADTGWEPRAVYEHLEWLMSPNVLPFPVHITSRGTSLRTDLLEKATQKVDMRFAAIPFFSKEIIPAGTVLPVLDIDDNVIGERITTKDEIRLGIGRRQCTKEYKIEPIARKQRELLGYAKGVRIPKGSVDVLIGISTDEAVRMKPPRYVWQTNIYSLVDKRMSRWDCYNWLERHDYPAVRPHEATLERPTWPPKSACLGCPYMSNEARRVLRDGSPEEWTQTVEDDKSIRDGGPLRGMRGTQYMHRDCVPLDEADIDGDDEQTNLFGNECEGVCGV